MNDKTPLLNNSLNESIYMMQPNGFIAKDQNDMVYKLHKFIYGLKQTFRSWNKHFDHAVKSFNFNPKDDEPCVYKKVQEIMVVFMVLYVDDILFIGNDAGQLSSIKI